MSSIIRASQYHSAVQRVAFNFDDMAVQASRYLDKVRVEAAQIVAAARQEADGLRKRAEAEGRAAGQKAVEQMVEKQVGQQLATLLPALRKAIQDVQQAKQSWMCHWERSAVHLAAAIARRVIRRELAAQPEITLSLVRESLELAAGSAHIRIYLHPSDQQALGRQVEALLREMAPLATTEIVGDAEIAAGGCRLETRFGTIDQQVDAQLARIEEELT